MPFSAVSLAYSISNRPDSLAEDLSSMHRMMSDHKVNLVDDNPANFYIIFHGPKDSK